MSKVRSAKGEMVDFDLLRIKAQIAASPKTTVVKARESFIDQKLKRRLKRNAKPVEPLAPASPGTVTPTSEVVVDPVVPASEPTVQTDK